MRMFFCGGATAAGLVSVMLVMFAGECVRGNFWR
jgi:hypothetical protein